ncbi:MAG: 4-phosphopantetheinyl transferase [Panacagrimonas sp.]|jgi:4'-phosphopantetheinyl transferase|nr:4'-phosphopantetheinyl transferase superfamily protein [Panacagrimonas sp.]MCC2658524.1 4-phosphopantetheinyl transferase [Panacagrimonas sp.]
MLSPERISVLFAGDDALEPALEAAWLDDLSADRRARLESMPDPADRRRSLIAGRLLLRGTQDLALPVHAATHVSTAHCAGRVVCAVSRDTPLGVDVEPLDANPPGRTDLYVNADERTFAGDDPQRLLWLWTRKEAVAKAASRRGLRLLGQIDVRSDRTDCEGRSWLLRPLDLGPGFVAHLACVAPPPPIVIRAHSPESLR